MIAATAIVTLSFTFGNVTHEKMPHSTKETTSPSQGPVGGFLAEEIVK